MSAFKYGYVRVSTAEQNTDKQHDVMVEKGIDPRQVFEDKLSGANVERPALENLKKFMPRGSELYVWSIDRLGRDTYDLINLAKYFEERGVIIHFIKEGITLDPLSTDIPTQMMSKMFFHICASLAEMSRRNIKLEQRKGIDARRARGLPFGRPFKDAPKEMIENILTQHSMGVSLKELLKENNIGQTLYYAKIREYGLTPKSNYLKGN